MPDIYVPTAETINGLPVTVKNPINNQVIESIDLDLFDGMERIFLKRMIFTGELVRKPVEPAAPVTKTKEQK